MAAHAGHMGTKIHASHVSERGSVSGEHFCLHSRSVSSRTAHGVLSRAGWRGTRVWEIDGLRIAPTDCTTWLVGDHWMLDGIWNHSLWRRGARPAARLA